MDIKYYAFALFIAGLVCLIAILCKVLFADLRRQHKLLDEKETKILDLYRAVESIIEDFEDQSKAAMDEIREYETRAAKRMAALAATPPPPSPPPEPQKPQKETVEFKPPQMEVIDSNRMRVAGEVLARAESMAKGSAVVQKAVASKADNSDVFQRLFDDTVLESENTRRAEDQSAKPARQSAILSLAENGKTAAQIAKELGITQNEVNLVIGLTAKR